MTLRDILAQLVITRDALNVAVKNLQVALNGSARSPVKAKGTLRLHWTQRTDPKSRAMLKKTVERMTKARVKKLKGA